VLVNIYNNNLVTRSSERQHSKKTALYSHIRNCNGGISETIAISFGALHGEDEEWLFAI